MWVLDEEDRTTFVNRTMAQMLGTTEERAGGTAFVEFVDEEDRTLALANLRRAHEGVDHFELRLRRRDGRPVWGLVAVSPVHDESGGRDGTLAMVTDITERKSAEDELRRQALHDTLTELPNRALLIDRLRQALARRRRTGMETTVLFLDVDRFKWINDSLGHRVGDRLLVMLGERLREFLRPSDTVARLGGDEFVVLCEDLRTEDDAMTVVDRLSAAMATPFELEGRTIGITVSIGIAFASETGDDTPETLLQDADSAMYRAKEQGRHRVELFDGDMRSRALSRLDTASALRHGLERGELQVRYQPIVELRNGHVAGVEARAHWQRPNHGLVSPTDLMPVAEDTGLVLPLGAFVISEACRQVAEWNTGPTAATSLLLSVHLSARQLGAPGLADVVAAALEQSGLDPALLRAEITAGVLVDEGETAFDALRSLRRLGVKVAVDVFGSGYWPAAHCTSCPSTCSR